MHPKYTLCEHLAKFQVLVWVFGPVGIAKMAQNDDFELQWVAVSYRHTFFQFVLSWLVTRNPRTVSSARRSAPRNAPIAPRPRSLHQMVEIHMYSDTVSRAF